MDQGEETLKTCAFKASQQRRQNGTRIYIRMTDTVIIIGSFLLAFKAILIEGSEVAILSLATIKQLGRNNILFGVIAGGLGSIITFLVVWRIFLLLPAIIIDFATAIVLFYFSSQIRVQAQVVQRENGPNGTRGH